MNGAKLHSKANVQVAAGNSEVIFENLSPYIYAQSLQVKLAGKAKLLSAKFRMHYIECEHQEAKIQHLQDSLTILMDIESDLNDEIYSYEQEEKLLNEVYSKMINSSSDWVKALTPVAMNDFKQFPEEYAQKLRKIRDKLRALNRTKRKIQKENISIQNRIRNLAPKNTKTTGEIVLQLNSTTVQNIDITCIYLITAAAWTTTLTYASNKIAGTLANPVLLNINTTTDKARYIPLNKGWTMFSVNSQSWNAPINTALASLKYKQTGDLIKTANKSASYSSNT